MRINAIHAKSTHENPAHKTSKIKFDIAGVQCFDVPAYSDHYALRPSQIVISNLGVHQMKPHMDISTGKYSAVINDRKIKVFKTRANDLAMKRCRLIIDQLAHNGFVWLYECASNAMITKLVTMHSHHSQRAFAQSDPGALMDSFHLGCGIIKPSLAEAKDLDVGVQADVVHRLVVGEADQVAHRMLIAHDKTLDVQRVAGVLMGDTTINLQQTILAPELGATRKAHKEEPFSKREKVLRMTIVTD